MNTKASPKTQITKTEVTNNDPILSAMLNDRIIKIEEKFHNIDSIVKSHSETIKQVRSEIIQKGNLLGTELIAIIADIDHIKQLQLNTQLQSNKPTGDIMTKTQFIFSSNFIDKIEEKYEQQIAQIGEKIK